MGGAWCPGEPRWQQRPRRLTRRRPEVGCRAQPRPTCTSLSPAGQSTPARLYESETEDLLMPGGLPAGPVGGGCRGPEPWGRASSSPNPPSGTSPWSEMHSGRQSFGRCCRLRVLRRCKDPPTRGSTQQTFCSHGSGTQKSTIKARAEPRSLSSPGFFLPLQTQGIPGLDAASAATLSPHPLGVSCGCLHRMETPGLFWGFCGEPRPPGLLGLASAVSVEAEGRQLKAQGGRGPWGPLLQGRSSLPGQGGVGAVPLRAGRACGRHTGVCAPSLTRLFPLALAQSRDPALSSHSPRLAGRRPVRLGVNNSATHRVKWFGFQF